MSTEPTMIADSVRDFALMPGYPDTQRTHPFDGCCKVCGTTLPTAWRRIDHHAAPGWHAVNCCDACYEAAKQANEVSLDRWLDDCPPEFRQDWDNTKGDQQLMRAVLNFDPDKRKAMTIVGPSGSAKTRAVWQLLRRFTLQGIQWHFATALDLLEGISADAARAKVLVIDDLGNDPLHANKEVALLKIIRRRCDWHMPFIVTTQFKGDELTKRFTDRHTAQAVIRRLREFSDIVVAQAQPK